MTSALIERGVLADLDALEALENLAFAGDRLSRRSLRDYLRSPRAALLVARVDGGLAGYGLAAFHSRSEACRIYSVATHPAFAGRGIGRALIAAIEAEAARRGKQAVRLEVREDNAGAIALYEKLGFTRFARIADYYEDGAAALRFSKTVRR